MANDSSFGQTIAALDGALIEMEGLISVTVSEDPEAGLTREEAKNAVRGE